MEKNLVIEPVTRIEGHAKVTIHLDDAGKVEDARMHVVEFRGFEKFCEGRLFTEMPMITPRICGICPISHHLASSKAGDAILGVEPPRTATLLRRLIHMGQVIQSHALSFFHLSAPDILLGMDADPAIRNVIGLIQEYPDIARKGIRMRKYGQEIIGAVAGRKIHPTFSLPGGVNTRLSEQTRDELLEGYEETLDSAKFALDFIKQFDADNSEMAESFANFPSNFLGLINQDGALELYDGNIRMRDADGEILESEVNPSDYLDIIAEATEEWSYLKFPFYRKQGYPTGNFRVGPLGRLNVATSITTPLADAELAEFKKLGDGKPVHGTFYYHHARLIEALYAVEHAKELLEDPDICGWDLMAHGPVKNEEGVGVIEAPRGTLYHHYWVNKSGQIEKVNLIVSTGQNNLSMNAAVKAVAEQYVDGTKLEEGMLNRVEAAIRCYDPCLSCSTHAVGQMPLLVDLVDVEGKVLDSTKRG